MQHYEHVGSRYGQSARWSVPLALFVLFAAAVDVLAQTPPDAVFRDFAPTDEYLFELDGNELVRAEIYFSERAVAYLVLAPQLASPLLISPRTQSVETVDLMKVVKRSDGSIDLLADAVFNQIGPFRLAGQEVQFQIGGQSARLRQSPPILGFVSSATLLQSKREYARLAYEYDPAADAVHDLRSMEPTRIIVYFGTWSPACRRLVPRMMRVEGALEGSSLRFDYYGLPSPIAQDPLTARYSIHGVPTAIVYVGDREVGRLGANELNSPETSLLQVLTGR